MSRRSRNRNRQQRARYARTNSNLLVGGDIPSGQEPSQLWWWGDDRFIFTPDKGSHLAAVTRATNLICNTLATLPWRLLGGGLDPGSSVYELPSPRWITDPMLLRPDARYGPSPTPAAHRLPGVSFWSQFLRSTLMAGCGNLIFEEAADAAPVAGTLRVLHPDAVSTVEEPYLHRRIGDPSAGVETDREGRFTIGGRRYRLVELLNPLSPVDEYGCAMGILEMHAAEHGIARQHVAYETGAFRNGVPSGFLKVSVPNFKKEQADDLKAKWMAAHGGDKKSVAVLNSTTDFTPLSFSPVDMALIESRKLSLVDIANMFGIPVYFLNGGDSGGLTYSNAESRSRDLIQFSLMPWASALEGSLTALLPQGQYIEVAFDGLLRADTASRFAAYSQALKDGWLTVNEVRLAENLGPIEDARPFGGVLPQHPGGGN